MNSSEEFNQYTSIPQSFTLHRENDARPSDSTGAETVRPQYRQQTQSVSATTCPNCGSPLDADADVCESCHQYVRRDVCSFCGSALADADAFCPECGSPRGGIVCPVCRTVNEFAFCRQCGTPLTDEARQLAAAVHSMPEYKEMELLASELQALDKELPIANERDKARQDECDRLRERVLTLLAQDRGTQHPVIPPVQQERLTQNELSTRREQRMKRLTQLLEQMEQLPQPRPAQVRNYAMAQKPQGVRMVWVCNYKHAMHSSPCGCAKPQMGGKWVLLGHGTTAEIHDDK